MIKTSKAKFLSGLACLVIAAFGVMLLVTQPAQSKNDRTKDGGDGVVTTLGF